jgi:hypothetical protein
MKRWLIVFFCPSIALAQNVQITEITPHTLAHQPEWFEFRVSGTDTVDMTDWHISNGKNKPKPLADFIETLAAGEGASKTENEFIFDLNQTGYFSFSPSPSAPQKLLVWKPLKAKLIRHSRHRKPSLKR